MAKKIYIVSHHNGRATIWGATQEEMNNGIFGYDVGIFFRYGNGIFIT